MRSICTIIIVASTISSINCKKKISAQNYHQSENSLTEPVLDYGEDESADDIQFAGSEMSGIPLLDDLIRSFGDQDKIVGGTPTQAMQLSRHVGMSFRCHP